MHTAIFGSNKLPNLSLMLIVYVVYFMSLFVSTGLSSRVVKKTENVLLYLNIPEFRYKREDDKSTNDPSNIKPADKTDVIGDTTVKKTGPAFKPTMVISSVSVQPEKLNCSQLTGANKTECLEKNAENNDYVKSIIQQMSENRGMLLRTLYVTLGVTGIVVVYFVLRSVWLRKKHTKSRKYGVLPRHGDHRDMEMEPLGDGNDDDDDYTVFEANGRKK